MHDQDENDILARLKLEFIDAARDQLDDIDHKLDEFSSGEVSAETVLLSVQREIHNIKGQGATFGYPLTSRVAHMLEDYLINANGIREDSIANIRVYLQLMANFVSQGEPGADEDPQDILNALPSGQMQTYSAQKDHQITVLLVMPSGMQRKMVAKELLSCGFRVMRAYDCNEALSVAVDLIPDFVFINYDMTPFSGRELCDVFTAVDKLRGIHIILLTSYDLGDEHLQNLPDTVSVVKKQKNFTEPIGELLIKWGVFGNIPDE